MGCGDGDDEKIDGVKNTAGLCFKYKIRKKINGRRSIIMARKSALF